MRRLGKLTRYVTIEQNTPTNDAAGQPIESWSTLVDNVPCEILGVTGGETLRGRQVDATATHTIRTRWRSDVTPLMRVTDDRSRTLNIVAVTDKTGEEREMWIDCKEER